MTRKSTPPVDKPTIVDRIRAVLVGNDVTEGAPRRAGWTFGEISPNRITINGPIDDIPKIWSILEAEGMTPPNGWHVVCRDDAPRTLIITTVARRTVLS